MIIRRVTPDAVWRDHELYRRCEPWDTRELKISDGAEYDEIGDETKEGGPGTLGQANAPIVCTHYWPPFGKVRASKKYPYKTHRGVDIRSQQSFGGWAAGPIPAATNEFANTTERSLTPIKNLDLVDDQQYEACELVGEDLNPPKRPAGQSVPPPPGLTSTTTTARPPGAATTTTGSGGGSSASGGGLEGQYDVHGEPHYARLVSSPLPSRWPTLRMAGTERSEQHLLGIAGWTNLLVSDHRGPRAQTWDFSTRVADLHTDSITDAIMIDEERTAVISTAIAPKLLPERSCAVALTLGKVPGSLMAGGGLFASNGWLGQAASPTGPAFPGTTTVERGAVAISTVPGGPAPQNLGQMGETFGGLVSAGAGALDQHRHPKPNADGEWLCPGHFQLAAPMIYENRPDKDGPIQVYLDDWKKVVRAGGPYVECEVRFDKDRKHNSIVGERDGKWAIQVPMPMLLAEPPPKKPPTDFFPPLPPPFSVPRTDGWHIDTTKAKANLYSVASSWAELGAPAFLARPSLTNLPGRDTRYLSVISPGQLERDVIRAPVAGRIEAFGRQRARGWAYNKKAGQGGRYFAPTVDGGFVVQPPERSVDGLTERGTSSTTMFVFDRVASGWGRINRLAASGVSQLYSGFSDQLDETNQRLERYHHDSTGARTLISEINSQGADLQADLDGIFGDGSGGDATKSSSADIGGGLALYYENLTISAFVDTGNRLVCVRDTLTLTSFARLQCNGGAGDDGVAGGAGGAASPSGYFNGAPAGGDGGANAQGSDGAGASGSLGSNGAAGGTATDGGATINTGGAAGSVTAASYVPRLIAQWLDGRDRDVTLFRGAASGSGGGAVGASCVGGGGGGAGGLCVVFARHVVCASNASFRAHGGEGGFGYVTGAGNIGAGGGGGGGGGMVVLVYQTFTVDGVLQTPAQVASYLSASGGTGGDGTSSGSGTGGDGSPGTAGRVLAICVGGC